MLLEQPLSVPEKDIVVMRLHRIAVCILLAGSLCLTPQASANVLRGVRFGQHGALSRVVFDLQQEAAYRLETSGEREPQFFALGEVFGGDWTTTDHRLGVQKQARGANLHTMTYATHIACDCICSLAVVVGSIRRF